LRTRGCAQVVFFVNDTTVSKGMVKYVGSLPSESIVDVEGVVTKPEAAVDGCTQKEIEIDVRFVPHTLSLLPQVAVPSPLAPVAALAPAAALAARGACGGTSTGGLRRRCG